MVQTKLFKSNQSQAVRLPKPVALPDEIKEVRITVIGNSRLISPVNQSWDLWFEEAGVTEDFMVERGQPVAQERESL
jgi:antitoxin VapB